MILYLIRHTTPDIGEGICYGQTDLDVAESFANELIQVKKQISNTKFDKIYSSPLKRCTTLSDALFGDNFTTDPRLMELHFGDWELKKWNELSGDHWEKWTKDFIGIPCPNGESFLDQHKRVTEFFDELKNQPYNTVAIVSHGGTIRSMLSTINNWKLENIFDHQVDYGAVIKVDI